MHRVKISNVSVTEENAYHFNFPEPKVMSSNEYFVQAEISPKPKDSLFTVLNDKGKQQILTFRSWNHLTFLLEK